MAGFVGIFYIPSLYTYVWETTKILAPAEAKGVFAEKQYIELVARLS